MLCAHLVLSPEVPWHSTQKRFTRNSHCWLLPWGPLRCPNYKYSKSSWSHWECPCKHHLSLAQAQNIYKAGGGKLILQWPGRPPNFCAHIALWRSALSPSASAQALQCVCWTGLRASETVQKTSKFPGAACPPASPHLARVRRAWREPSLNP